MAKDKEREDSKGNRRKTDSVIKNKTNKQQQKKNTISLSTYFSAETFLVRRKWHDTFKIKIYLNRNYFR